MIGTSHRDWRRDAAPPMRGGVQIRLTGIENALSPAVRRACASLTAGGRGDVVAQFAASPTHPCNRNAFAA
jgi:hypothetical protein